MKIGYLGPIATFSESAVRFLFPTATGVSLKTIPACIDAVEQNKVDYALVPLENTIEGSVNLTIDYLIHERTLDFVGEAVIPITQHLMMHEQADISSIQTVYSHPHAIAQCHKFLYENLRDVEVEYTSSTAGAAKFVAEQGGVSIAAIANSLAAEVYGLKIVKSNIHDFQNNHTRFIVLQKQGQKGLLYTIPPNGFKTTIMITLPSDQAGALHQVLSAFAWRRLNLSKIESRPMKTGLGNYFFLIDVEQGMDDVLIPGAIAEIEALGCTTKILGSYPYFHCE